MRPSRPLAAREHNAGASTRGAKPMGYWLGLAVAVAVGFPAASAQAQAPSPTATQTPPPAATNTPTPAPTATSPTVPVGPGPTIQAIAAPPPTGDFILDRALLAIAGTNPDDVSRQLHFLRVPCNPAHAIPCPSGQTLGNPPFAPATGTGPRPADRGGLPLGTVAMVALGIAMAVWGTLRMWLRERVARSGNP